MGRTAIFGGSFNPPHLMHEKLIKTLLKRQDIERVLLVPTRDPVHKAGRQMAPPSHRLNMCKIVADKYSGAKAWDIELNRKEKSYTYLTLLDYKKEFGDKPYFLLGADMLVTLHTWYNYRELLKLCDFICVYREGEDRALFDKAIERVKNDGGNIEEFVVTPSDISSTKARGNLSGNVSKEIEAYINENGLYRDNKDMTIEEYKEHIKARLSEKRYYHSLCVAEEAVRLADRYGADKEKAYLAGLLHDVLKDTPSDIQLKFAKEFGIILSALELGAKKLYHSIIGSAYIEKVLKLNDKEIIDAVRYHTTAKKDMSTLAKVLYLADYTSRDRDYDGVDEMREAVEQSMEKAMRIALQFTVEDLKAKGCPVHPDTLDAYDEFVK